MRNLARKTSSVVDPHEINSFSLPLSYLIFGISSPVIDWYLRNGSQGFVAADFSSGKESFDRNSRRKDFSYRYEYLANAVHQSHARWRRKDGEKCSHNWNFAKNFEAIVSSHSTRFRVRWCYSSLKIASHSATPQITWKIGMFCDASGEKQISLNSSAYCRSKTEDLPFTDFFLHNLSSKSHFKQILWLLIPRNQRSLLILLQDSNLRPHRTQAPSRSLLHPCLIIAPLAIPTMGFFYTFLVWKNLTQRYLSDVSRSFSTGSECHLLRFLRVNWDWRRAMILNGLMAMIFRRSKISTRAKKSQKMVMSRSGRSPKTTMPLMLTSWLRCRLGFGSASSKMRSVENVQEVALRSCLLQITPFFILKHSWRTFSSPGTCHLRPGSLFIWWVMRKLSGA